jgi:hypothetical protein
VLSPALAGSGEPDAVIPCQMRAAITITLPRTAAVFPIAFLAGLEGFQVGESESRRAANSETLGLTANRLLRKHLCCAVELRLSSSQTR